MVGRRRPLPPKICAQSDPPPLKSADFESMFAYNVSTVRAIKKTQLSQIGSRPHAFQRAIDEVCTLPLTPPKMAKKINLSFL